LKQDRYGYSSEIYLLDSNDVQKLEDSKTTLPADILEKVNDEVVILLGNHNLGTKDRLVKGREFLDNAIKNNRNYVPVRIIFKITTPKFDFFTTLMKRRREKYRGFGSNIYHISPQVIRDMNIERNIRTSSNAYKSTRKIYYLPPDERKARFKELYESIRI